MYNELFLLFLALALIFKDSVLVNLINKNIKDATERKLSWMMIIVANVVFLCTMYAIMIYLTPTIIITVK